MISSKVLTGADQILNYPHLFKDKKIGLITNPTGINQQFQSTIDILYQHTDLVALYAPEHGIRGNIQAGEVVYTYIDEKTNLPVYSLYGKNKKPSYEILQNIDTLVFDIQDVGARFYTYIYTLAYAMESCAKYNKNVVVLDRPNPLNGTDVEGNLLNPAFSSFIGLYPIPQRHGLTIGEIAQFFNTEFHIHCDLHVIPLKNWDRSMYYDDTGLPWVAPSPNLPTLQSAIVYPGTCMFSGTNVSEGRGTTQPFELIGAPWINALELSTVMNQKALPGAYFRPAYFTPTFYKYKNELCNGVQIHITNRKQYKPVKTALTLMYTIMDLYKDNFTFLPPVSDDQKHKIDYSTGDCYIREKTYSLEELLERYEKEGLQFKKQKTKYHLYC